MLIKTWFLLLYLFSIVELDFILFSWFHDTKQLPEILNLKIEMLFGFQNAMNIKSIGLKLMYRGSILPWFLK